MVATESVSPIILATVRDNSTASGGASYRTQRYFKKTIQMEGYVKCFHGVKGWGFVENSETGESAFVHYSNIIGKPDSFRTLNEGDRVSYDIEQAPKGPCATHVKVIETA